MISDAGRWVKLPSDLFGAKELSRFKRPDVGPVHAGIKIDDSMIMLSQATQQFPAN